MASRFEASSTAAPLFVSTKYLESACVFSPVSGGLSAFALVMGALKSGTRMVLVVHTRTYFIAFGFVFPRARGSWRECAQGIKRFSAFLVPGVMKCVLCRYCHFVILAISSLHIYSLTFFF